MAGASRPGDPREYAGTLHAPTNLGTASQVASRGAVSASAWGEP
jgi:hypothetical protein